MEWLRDYPTETRTAPIICEEAGKVLGFIVTTSTLMPILRELGKKTSMQVAREGGKAIDSDSHQAKINAVMFTSITKLYRALGIEDRIPTELTALAGRISRDLNEAV